MGKLTVILDLRSGRCVEPLLFARLVYCGGIDRCDVVPEAVQERVLERMRESN